MSAIAAVVTAGGIVFASDGIAYQPVTGIVSGISAKVFALPNLNCCIGHVGVGGLAVAMIHNIYAERAVQSFDDLLGIFGAEFLRTADLMKQSRLWPKDGSATAVVGGWSDARERFELYKINSKSRETVDVETGKREWSDAGQLVEVGQGGAWASTSPTMENMRRFDIRGKQHSALDVAGLLVCANRASSGPDPDSPGGYYGVGAFLQMTVLQRTQIRQWIAHRWPDPLGEPIDPTRGEPAPPLPLSLPT